jgi:hypothetical protein
MRSKVKTPNLSTKAQKSVLTVLEVGLCGGTHDSGEVSSVTKTSGELNVFLIQSSSGLLFHSSPPSCIVGPHWPRARIVTWFLYS